MSNGGVKLQGESETRGQDRVNSAEGYEGKEGGRRMRKRWVGVECGKDGWEVNGGNVDGRRMGEMWVGGE